MNVVFQQGSLPYRILSRALFSRLAVAAASLVLAACASLPDVRYLNTSLDTPSSPTIKTADG